MSSVRSQMISISLDGYVAGPNQGPYTFVTDGIAAALEPVKVVASPTVTHVRYRVVH